MKKYVKNENGILSFFENQQLDNEGNSLNLPLVDIPEDYDTNADKYSFNGAEFKDISDTDDYKAKILAAAKTAKQTENENAALAYIATQEITYVKDNQNLLFYCNKDTQNDLTTAGLGIASGTITEKQWTTSNAITINLTKDDISAIMLQLNNKLNPIWKLWGDNVNQINACTTVEAVNAIVIDYSNAGA